MEENKVTIKRVKVPSLKSALITLTICIVVLLIFSLVIAISNKRYLSVALFMLVCAALISLTLIPVVNNVKKSIATNTYPENAIILDNNGIEIITDKSTVLNYSEIKSVRGIKFVGAGVFTYKIYCYGTLIIKLKNNTKITLLGIEDVLSVANMIKSKINKN